MPSKPAARTDGYKRPGAFYLRTFTCVKSHARMHTCDFLQLCTPESCQAYGKFARGSSHFVLRVVFNLTKYSLDVSLFIYFENMIFSHCIVCQHMAVA